MGTVLLEARAFKPFKSDEEYLIAMKEDLAEWLQTMYPHLNIHAENFIERLETGVALCEHANAVKHQANEYVKKKQAKKVMTRSVTGSLAQARAIIRLAGIKYFSSAKSGTFFARDNVSNFINWCRTSLEIIECLLFESDDLIMKKNEKHVILCLLEVARRGAKFGMLAPMLIQMERQIDKEIAADQKKLNGGLEEQDNVNEDSDSDLEDEKPVYLYGPIPQIITNDLKGLDEMVRDLVEKCTCPTQFPMIRVSEGKYRIGDTRVLIFVRILRNHVMVRVGGGWDTLSHYLDKHDPCRCKTQHRTTQGARFVNKPGAMDLHGSQVYYNRSATSASSHTNAATHTDSVGHSLGPPMNSLSRSRSRSPSHSLQSDFSVRRSLSPSLPRRSLGPPSSHQNIRSRSPTPNYTSTYSTKLSTSAAASRTTERRHHSPGKGLQHKKTAGRHHHHRNNQHDNIITSVQIPLENNDRPQPVLRSEATLQVFETDNQSDTTSEMSDEGYRSLGIINQDKNKQRSSMCSHNSADDSNDHGHQTNDDTDELNDFGLRKTQFSQRIYQDSDVGTALPKSTQEPTASESSPKKLPPQRIISRANSADRMFLREPMTDRSVFKVSAQQHQTAGDESGWGTWNGRQKRGRTSIGGDEKTFPTTFSRTSPARRSLSALPHHERRASSVNSSPIKGRLRQELLNAMKSTDDDELIAHQVQDILKKYGRDSNIVDDNINNDQEPKFLTRDNSDGTSPRSSRKDSRSDKQKLSRIPAPVLHGV